MRTWQTLAFLLLGCAVVAAGLRKEWPIALVAAALGCELIPVVFATS